MREGMLWFDNSDQGDMATRIMRAVRYYHAKYGVSPTVCFVHPSMLAGNPATVEDVEVRTSNSILPGHFWLGIAEPAARSAA